MEHTLAYKIAINKLIGIHQQYGRLCELIVYKSELYEEKLNDLNNLEAYCKEKLRLSELSEMLERLRVAKENCKIEMNRYKQEELC